MNPLILIAALFFQAVTPVPGAGVISGQLRGVNGQSVVGVRVGAMALSPGNVPVSSTSAIVSLTLTDNAGRYRLENVPPGQYYIIAGLVETPTYYPGVPSLSGATIVTVSPSGALTGIDFPIVISPGVTVKGRVVRPPNMPVNISRVLLSGSNGQDTTINPDGTFEFPRVRRGT